MYGALMGMKLPDTSRGARFIYKFPQKSSVNIVLDKRNRDELIHPG